MSLRRRADVSWTKLDDGFWMHPKVLMAGNEAAGIFARCLSYCAGHDTCGVIPMAAAIEIAGSLAALERVIYADLMEFGDDRVRIPDFRRHGLYRIKVPRWLRAKVIERDGLLCGLCGKAVSANDVHIDHVIPLALGGPTTIDNLQVAHSTCNIKKGARI